MNLYINANAQYFSIKGRKFYDENEQPFTPVAMTYMLYLTHNGPKKLNPTISDLQSNYYLSPNNHYGGTQEFEFDNQADCDSQILKDISKIKSLGFNTIRLTFRTRWNYHGSPQANKFYVRSFQNCNPIGNCWDDADFVELSKHPVTLFEDDPVINFLIEKMDDIITIITSPPLSMKIMLEIGVGGSMINSTSVNANDYVDLLKYVASHYSSNRSLISYNTASEPTFSENNYVGKSKVCDWTSDWYDAIKQADPNHLISTHGHFEDIIFWDPSIIKADYYEVHPYPQLKSYEKTSPGYDVAQAAIDRFKGKLYWYRNHCPKPVMIGETGFRASDFSNQIYQAQYPGILQDPLYYDGTIAQQRTYGIQTFQNAFDCECLAYNWWGFQDDWNWKEVGFALIHHGTMTIPTTTAFDKPVASVFSTVPVPTTADCVAPMNYLDPFNCGYFNTAHNNAITGTVSDANGNPVKGAVVQALCWLNTDDPNGYPYDGDESYDYEWYYFNADDSGNFKVIPYNYTNIGDDRVIYMRVSAPGANKIELGEMYDSVVPKGWSDIKMQPGHYNIVLNKVEFQYDGLFDGEIISQTDRRSLIGWNSVSVSNTDIFGESDISARQEIHIGTEFHAVQNSEVHIYTSKTFVECNDISSFLRIRQDDAKVQLEVDNMQSIGDFIQDTLPSVNVAGFFDKL